MDELLRARLRAGPGADRRIRALRMAMSAVDALSRALGGQAFFALREAEELLRELDGRAGMDLVEALLACNGGSEIVAHGLEHIPSRGPVIIGATHPVGTFDFIAHAGVLFPRRPDLKVVANREAERFLGTDRIIAVDLDRREKVLAARRTLAGMQAQLERGGALLIFGSGRVADMREGLLFEPPWRGGITRLSEATRAPIVPASAQLRNSRAYYRTRRLFRLLSGGNADFGRLVASLRYASELLAQLGRRHEVHYGPPLPPGSAPEVIKKQAESLVPGLYRPEAEADR